VGLSPGKTRLDQVRPPATLAVAIWAQFTPACASGGKRPPR